MPKSNRKKFINELKRRALIIPGVVDCLTAFLAKCHGFKGIYLTGAGYSVTHLGKPDIGFLGRDHLADAAERIVSATQLPLLVDVDTGFGGPADVTKTVRALEQAGALGVQIEDQVFPKRCGHLSGKSLVEPKEMVRKIQAALKARKDPHFMIVARTDARAVEGVESAYRRAMLYKQAGADMIFPEALQTKAEFRAFGQKKMLGLLMANMTEFGRSPALTADELASLGYRFILYPMTAFRVAAYAVESAFKHLRKKGTSRGLVSRMQTRQELYELIGYHDFDQWQKRLEKEKHL